MDKLYTVKDVAESMSISEFEIRELCKQGKFPGLKKIGRQWRIPESGIESFLAAQEVVPPAPVQKSKRTKKKRPSTEGRITMDVFRRAET